MSSAYTINFVIPAADIPTVDTLRRRVGDSISERVNILPYREADRLQPFEPGLYIFGNFTMQKGARREFALRLAELLDGSPGHRIFNHPLRALNRLQLLNVMFEEGDNVYRAWSADSLPDETTIRYPVFVRDEHNHQGSLSKLLNRRDDLEAELSRLTRWRRHDLEDLIVVEFCDTSDETGLFRKYSAFRIGDRIITRCLNFSHDWMVKQGDDGYRREGTNEPHLERIREEEEYMRSNPHLPWLKKVFDRAAIEYGRVDYSLLDGRPQLWEINTFPQMGGRPSGPPAGPEKQRLREERKVARTHFYQRLGPALDALTEDVPGAESLYLELDPALAAELERQRRKDDRRTWLRKVVASVDAKVPGFKRLRKGIGRYILRL